MSGSSRSSELSSISSSTKTVSDSSLPDEPMPTFGPQGLEFASYRLIQELGSGGMGTVYLAHDASHDRLVALKLSRKLSAYSPEDVARLRFEAQAAARLDHPHIVPIFTSGEYRNRYFISMKQIVGCSLRDLPIGCQADEVQLLSLVVDAVQHAHDRGILHRDLKPSNILVDERGEPYVSDFGLAKLLDSQAQLTQTGVRIGTPQYMSPEQATGEKTITVASDIYSLGVILYERLAGLRWQQHNSTTVREIFHSPRDPHRLAVLSQVCDRRLQTIVGKCLELHPQDRYASCRDLQRDLRCWLRGEPISTRPSSLLQKGGRWIWRHPWRTLASSAVAALIFLAMGLVIYNLQMRWQRRVVEYANLLDRTRLELLEQRPGWSARAVQAVEGAEALAFSGQRSYELSSLRVNLQIGLDVGSPRFRIPLENTRVLRFHPTQPLLFIAQKRASQDGSAALILVVDSLTGQHLHQFSIADARTSAPGSDNQENGVTDLALSRDGTQLAVVTRASNLIVYNIADLPAATEITRVDLTGHKLMRGICAGDDSVWIVMGYNPADGYKLWSISAQTGEIQTVRAFAEGIIDLAEVEERDGFIISQDGKFCWIDPRTLQVIDFHSVDYAGMIAYHSGWIAMYHRTQVTIYDANNGMELGSLAPPPGGLPLTRWDSPISFSPSGEIIAVADNERNQIHLWSANDLAYLQSCTVGDSQFNNICFDFSNTGLVAGSAGDRTDVFKMRPSALRPITSSNRLLRDATVSPAANALITISEDQPQVGQVDIYTVGDQSVDRVARFPLSGFPAYTEPRLEQSADGRQLAVLYNHPWNTLQIHLHSSTGDLLQTSGPLTAFRSMAFDAQGTLWSGCGPGLMGWRADDTAEPRQWSRSTGHSASEPVNKYSCILPIDKQRIILGDETGGIVCLQANNPIQIEFDLSICQAPIRCAAFDAASSRLALGDGQGQLFLLDLNSPLTQPLQIDAHWAGLSSLAWTNCGHLISAGLDRTVRYWRVDPVASAVDPLLKINFGSNVRRLFPDLQHDCVDAMHDLVLFRESTFALEKLEFARSLLQ